ncbi:MAG: hypothetical protein J5529_06060 [Prevotella sp.]|nr:hypothetical protein [Prevotella sp.]
MKREYQKPLAEIVYLNTDAVLDEETTDTNGFIPGDDPTILNNEGTFEEEEVTRPSKGLWD